MGLTRAFGLTLKSLFDQRALGEQTVETTNVVYRQNKRRLPRKNQHSWLAETWLNRMKARGEDVNDQEMRKKALNETFVHACVSPQHCAHSLALSFLYEENPILVKKYPRFLEEYISLIGPVLEAMQKGRANILYSRYNMKKTR